MMVLGPIAVVLPYARRWPVFLIPFFGLMFVANYSVYFYPLLFVSQYSSLFIPFVYLTIIEGLHRFERSNPKSKLAVAHLLFQFHRQRRLRHRSSARPVAGLVVVVIVVMGAFLLPYSPLNAGNTVPFNLQTSINANQTLFNEFEEISHMIPPSDPYVVFQEDMPTLLPRPLPYGNPLVPGYAQFGSNYSSGFYPLFDPITNSWVIPQIDYVISFPEDLQIYTWGNPSMFDLVRSMYSSGDFGILAEASGIILLEHNYTGPIKYFVPDDGQLAAPDFHPGVLGTVLQDGTIEGSNPQASSRNTLWSGNIPFLLPGSYTFILRLRTSSLSPGNSLWIGNPMSPTWILTSRNFSSVNNWTDISLTALVDAPLLYAPIVGFLSNWEGALDFGGISYVQTGFAPEGIFSNRTLLSQFLQLSSLVPRADPYLMFQTDMPMLLPRPEPYGVPMIPGVATFGTNYSAGHYPMINATTNDWIFPRIDYAIAYPYDLGSYDQGSPSIFDLISSMWSSGLYGDLGEASGMLLLQRGYVGPPRMYIPLETAVQTSSFAIGPAGVRLAPNVIRGSNPSTSSQNIAWSGYIPFLAPGVYNFTFLFRTSTLSSSDHLQIGNPMGANWVVTDSNFTSPGVWTNVSMNAVVLTPLVLAPEVGFLTSWSGSLDFGGLEVSQIAP
ncbi:MAG: DUF2079 domain-containing protein [Nitrososphaerota archaeon]|nr:DUF2079 domain-containing protein [Nitrososphaerota archaeon]